ncbi:MAG: RNA methyltransferase [Candidatus Poribacteria bacterium]|nr:RNA methyltransferase [Candidatus Poribacteria bacterium]MDE0502992.1 RNA methyltransferase [Candidatus Poribacteria bacterium]
MAVETKDYEAAIRFLRSSRSRKRPAQVSDRSESECSPEVASELVALMEKDWEHQKRTGEWQRAYQVFIAGWEQLEGVMVLTPVQESGTDLVAEISATNERALRELLLSFPRTKVGRFHCGGRWMFVALAEILDGHETPEQGDCCFIGIKRGSNNVSANSTFVKQSEDEHGNQRTRKRKDPVISEFRTLATLSGKLKQSKYTVEGPTLVQRAINDGLPVEKVAFTPNLPSDTDGKSLLNRMHRENLMCYQVNDGVMGALTTTRPVPSVMAAVPMNYRDADDFHLTPDTILLITDSVANPDNLGMVLRTADAAGVDGVLVIGDGTNPFHRNCVRASRGAVGRIPLLYCSDADAYFTKLIGAGFNLIAATSKTDKSLYDLEFEPPFAIVVGNENEGIRKTIVDLCTNLVTIPMAPGQSSLNVGVATGVLLYELVRRRNVRGMKYETIKY